MLIYDGFESHLATDVVDYCLDHHILPFCLPPHTTHRTQPLDVGVFSSLNNAYKKRINNIRTKVNKERFPKILAAARTEACTTRNAIAGFQKCGICPYNPERILYYCDSLPEPHISRPSSPLPQPHIRQTVQQLFEFHCSPPTTPHHIAKVWKESLSTITSTSPHSQKQLKCFEAWKSGVEMVLAQKEAAKEGERHLCEELIDTQHKPENDTRRIPIKSAKSKTSPGLGPGRGPGRGRKGGLPSRAEILERGNQLYKWRKQKDEEEATKKAKKAKRVAKEEKSYAISAKRPYL